ncbi:hypothetical protein CORC01_08808 [Colletotrichum orchidophilum]|uniref:Uncharacterized protein n=1 Tax=Colletotrichum orchidophilum TaxID=1209926 RepID=A0A1G4B3L3_9PEZI|nr:uncharacterized protein CORC01_08808 [Colletotrichum orchidophilum]OHE95956.1 hypothetical protein CORC01_08808 [Colletotrichum orchidophilum]
MRTVSAAPFAPSFQDLQRDANSVLGSNKKQGPPCRALHRMPQSCLSSSSYDMCCLRLFGYCMQILGKPFLGRDTTQGTIDDEVNFGDEPTRAAACARQCACNDRLVACESTALSVGGKGPLAFAGEISARAVAAVLTQH